MTSHADDRRSDSDAASELFSSCMFWSSTWISLPWRELGGGGFFFRVLCVFLTRRLPTSSRCSSSPTSEISCDVRGVSQIPYVMSKMDCLETDEASVMLPLSPAGMAAQEVPGVAEEPASGEPCRWPVKSSRLKELTSSAGALLKLPRRAFCPNSVVKFSLTGEP